MKHAAVLLAALLPTALLAQPHGDLFSDTWVGTDGLGRQIPTSEQVGIPKKNKTVGIFYFLTSSSSGPGPFDNSKILSADPQILNEPANPAWGPLKTPHFWGEPAFGYYSSDDEYVLRKHAELLSDAGVDVVIFDNSNGYTYNEPRDKLFKVWEEIRREGGTTPQIAFLCPFGNPGGLCTKTVQELYDDVYKPGVDSDLWFRWRGKPLILANPDYAPGSEPSGKYSAKLETGTTLGQTFAAIKDFDQVGGTFATYLQTESAITLSLYQGGPTGMLLAQERFANVADNSRLILDTNGDMPPGRYYLEISQPKGQIGWWSYEEDAYHNGEAYAGSSVVRGCRSLLIHDRGCAPSYFVSLIPDSQTAGGEIQNFFTFRAPIAPYNVKSPPANSWAWLQVFPQACEIGSDGASEEVAVGVAQNYNSKVNGTAPMSVDGAFGRSYHSGRMDPRPDAVDWGYNLAEQWNRALKLDPPFVFVTGWNEWSALSLDRWSRFTAPPILFVDEFDEEYSRDIEPMLGGFGDDYYYELVDFIRKYKGVRPIPPVKSVPIPMTDDFAGWSNAAPEYEHWTGSQATRDCPGVGSVGRYTNATGRNNIVSAKVSYDAENIYFFARTAQTLSPHTDPNWMLLYLKTKKNSKGWMGYDFVVDREVGDSSTSVERSSGPGYDWSPVGEATYKASGSQIQIAIPRSLLGLPYGPATIDFKWADNCYAKGDWTDFLLNGDAAPDGRFNYRASIQ